MNLRPYTAADLDALAALYRASVCRLGPAAYTPAQVAAWASFAEDRAAFLALLDRGYTVVAVLDGAPAAFCQLHPGDHVSLLYTDPRFARRGLATAVYGAVEAVARERGQRVLGTDASAVSRPFFEKQGFALRREEQTIRQGVSITRYQMAKRLADAESQEIAEPACKGSFLPGARARE